MTVIGLTTYSEPASMLVWQREFAMLHATYVAATERTSRPRVLRDEWELALTRAALQRAVAPGREQ